MGSRSIFRTLPNQSLNDLKPEKAILRESQRTLPEHEGKNLASDTLQ
jgi:hypothetical protein